MSYDIASLSGLSTPCPDCQGRVTVFLRKWEWVITPHGPYGAPGRCPGSSRVLSGPEREGLPAAAALEVRVAKGHLKVAGEDLERAQSRVEDRQIRLQAEEARLRLLQGSTPSES